MEVINITRELSQIGMNRKELLIVNAALNEVCNGIEIFEFETRIGASRESVTSLLREINSLLDKIDASNQQ